MVGKQIRMTGKEVIKRAADCYYGLFLPVAAGMSKSPEYRQAVLSGRKPEGDPAGFLTSDADMILSLDTPAGEVDAIYLDTRADFELFLQKIGHRCEPEAIRPDVGAMMISGVINWKKIEVHKRAYLEQGKLDWNAEFKRFTAVPENFKDRVLVLSGGPYSNFPAERAGYSQEEWKRISVDIRMYHECTHYICRTCWQEKKDAVMDEVTADAIGLIGAIGYYRKDLAAAFLGFTPEGRYTGGRLSVYEAGDLEKAKEEAWHWLGVWEQIGRKMDAGSDPFRLLGEFMSSL